MENQVFYRCKICGNLIAMVEDSGMVPVCCNQPMEKLAPGSIDASHEKHVPVITCDDRKVTITIGSTPHPMTEMHFIEWIWLQTTRGAHLRCLGSGCEPSACFRLAKGEEPLCAYAYCNLHGLWMACTGKGEAACDTQ